MHKKLYRSGTGSTPTEYGRRLRGVTLLESNLSHEGAVAALSFAVTGYNIRVFLVIGNWLKVVTSHQFWRTVLGFVYDFQRHKQEVAQGEFHLFCKIS